MKNIEYVRNNRVLLSIMWATIKLVLAFLIIKHFDYGLYVVLGYIFFSIESISSLQYLNAQEANLLFSNLHSSESTNIGMEVGELRKNIAELELRLAEAEIKIEDIT
ncbi:hypothetical protein [Shewanella zhangzhouensis]|uniref:hypothetical protein n=1 Tax=Shewanella zhangzhouensis TaxID=2864213 RepID=UPI001C65DEEC|nr:hypothetical protein [Shewanella zhangzhouensis]QYK06382.1 hypothetical protein K0H63_06065 [Shewanella zhangzhouensis]